MFFRGVIQHFHGVKIIGLGLGAVSVLDGVKCTNTKVLSEYIAHSDDPEAIVKLG